MGKERRLARAERERLKPQPYSRSRVERLDGLHPGLRSLVEDLLRRRFDQRQIARQVERRFGVKISASSIHRFWTATVRPREQAEAEAFRQARAQARALLEEMKADPKLDAAQIAEIMLVNQIVKDRMKLGEADIMDLYREQRERAKLMLQQRALQLRERQAKKVLRETKKSSASATVSPDVIRRISEIYGLTTHAPAPAPAPSASGILNLES